MHVIWNITKQWQAPASQMPGLAKCASASPCTSTRASFVGSHATMKKDGELFFLPFPTLNFNYLWLFLQLLYH